MKSIFFSALFATIASASPVSPVPKPIQFYMAQSDSTHDFCIALKQVPGTIGGEKGRAVMQTALTYSLQSLAPQAKGNFKILKQDYDDAGKIRYEIEFSNIKQQYLAIEDLNLVLRNLEANFSKWAAVVTFKGPASHDGYIVNEDDIKIANTALYSSTGPVTMGEIMPYLKKLYPECKN